MARSTRPPSSGRPITVSSTSRSVRSLATASSRGTRPFMGTSLLEVTMIRPGTGRHVVEGAEHGVVDADRDDGHPLGGDLHLRRDVLAGVLRHRDDGGQRPGHAHLHAEEAEPAPRGEALPGVGRVRQGQLAVHRDRVVQRGEQRPPVLDHARACRCRGTGCRARRRSRRGARASSWRARSEKASGSPKPAVHMMANSIQSSRRGELARGAGTRNGSGSR